MGVEAAAVSHVGKVRAVNEDACLSRPQQGLWAVADGMGGHARGDLASQALISALSTLQPNRDLDASCAAVADLIQFANDGLRQGTTESGASRQPGSTIVTLLLHATEAVVLWAGDSRAYRLRDACLEQLTRDHSYVQSLIDEGLLSPEEAERHPMASVITRAVGIDPTLKLDRRSCSALPGDYFLLCSDGLTRCCSDRELAQALSSHSVEAAVQALLDLTLERGAPDNVTIVLVRIL